VTGSQVTDTVHLSMRSRSDCHLIVVVVDPVQHPLAAAELRAAAWRRHLDASRLALNLVRCALSARRGIVVCQAAARGW
jgi:hypothetical protein